MVLPESADLTGGVSRHSLALLRLGLFVPRQCGTGEVDKRSIYLLFIIISVLE